MTANDARSSSSAALTIAGIALIVVPIIAMGVKFASFGWYMVLALWTLYVPVLLGLGWLIQIVIASTGYFGRRALFVRGRGRRRGIAAAWTTLIGGLLVALFFVDGGDTSSGSTFMYWTGNAGNQGLAAMSEGFSLIGTVALLGGWLWLLVEWIAAIIRRARERRRA